VSFNDGRMERLGDQRLALGNQTILLSFRGSIAYRKPSRAHLMAATRQQGWNDRLQAVAGRLLGHLPRHASGIGRYLVEFKGEGTGISWTKPYPSERKISYLELLRASVFTLSPPGDLWESYRTYEAIEMGSIPVIITNVSYKGCTRPAAHVLATIPGIVAVGDWTDLPAALDAAAKDTEARREAMLRWLATEKRAAFSGLK